MRSDAQNLVVGYIQGRWPNLSREFRVEPQPFQESVLVQAPSLMQVRELHELLSATPGVEYDGADRNAAYYEFEGTEIVLSTRTS